ncbi:trypsin-like peptidase domain-containing protein [Solwaraspora sp. WMMD937]|uniref:trypsin-like peptidase domain-containing protein n=1 Tax=Solwaraspora sp. WMMD937 TaxID=3016090 RepID=UPI00249C1279|nr:trypsin-like peptidase domain-containing protein [Solwaraspora sp. WMMD937]WFE21635.1 trypsin-like peptidase domain-containing protein [Solwaraspora sp. WMMD937]
MTVRRVSSRTVGADASWPTGVVAYAAAVAVALVVLVTPTPAAAAPPYTLDERALAIASPSLAYVEVVYTGYLRDKRSSAPLRASPITFTRRCSGFVVGTGGEVITNGLCVRPAKDTAAQNALYSLGRILIAENSLEADALDRYVADNLRQSIFTGLEAADEPDHQVYGQLGVASTGGLTESPAIPGEVTEVLDADAGNIALVKLEQQNLPTVELASSGTLDPGASLVVVGYATDEVDPRTATYSLRSKPVKVIGTGTRGSASVYRVNEDVGIHSLGGMAIDTNGHVVGVLDNDLELPDRANRALVPMQTITALLAEAGVDNALGETDQLFRSGLDAYFAGDYETAISQLGTVVENSPVNSVAQTYRQNATELQKIEDSFSSGAGWLIWASGAAGGALVIGLIMLVVLLLQRRARRQLTSAEPVPPAAPYPFSPASGYPGQPTPGYPSAPAYPAQQPAREYPPAPIYQPSAPIYQPPAPAYQAPPAPRQGAAPDDQTWPDDEALPDEVGPDPHGPDRHH